MKCLLCKYFSTENVEELLNHYVYFHQINENNYYFKELFHRILTVFIKNTAKNVKKFLIPVGKKSHSFLKHYEQIGGARNNRPSHIFKRGRRMYFVINSLFDSCSYNLFDAENAIDDFLEGVRKKIVASDNVEVEAVLI